MHNRGVTRPWKWPLPPGLSAGAAPGLQAVLEVWQGGAGGSQLPGVLAQVPPDQLPAEFGGGRSQEFGGGRSQEFGGGRSQEFGGGRSQEHDLNTTLLDSPPQLYLGHLVAESLQEECFTVQTGSAEG